MLLLSPIGAVMNSLYENILEELNPDYIKQLPAIWQVIYQSGIDFREVLFTEADRKQFATQRSTLFTPKDSDLEPLYDSIVKLFQAHSVAAMEDIVSSLKFQQRYLLYLYYNRTVMNWRQQVRASLN